MKALLVVATVALLLSAGQRVEAAPPSLLRHVVDSTPLNWDVWWADLYDLRVNASIGTPGQAQNFRLLVPEYNLDMLVADVKMGGGAFDPSKSSTFTKTGTFTEPGYRMDGTTGTDNVQIAGRSFDALPIRVLEHSQDGENDAVVGLGRPPKNDDSPWFLTELLKRLPEQVVTITADTFEYDSRNKKPQQMGTFTLGGRAEDRCSQDWAYLPEVPLPGVWSEANWGFNVTKLSAGKFTTMQSGVAYVQYDSAYFFMPSDIYDSVYHALGGKDKKSGLPCDLKEDIVLTFGKIEFRIPPADYLLNPGYNVCYLAGDSQRSDGVFILPNKFLKSNCLLYDYAEPRIGLAKRL